MEIFIKVVLEVKIDKRKIKKIIYEIKLDKQKIEKCKFN